MKRKVALILSIWALIETPLWASSNFELGQSVSSFYDSRSVFSNPAALGYQTELNGSSLSLAQLYGLQSAMGDEWESSLSYGYLGTGWERLQSTAGVTNRFSLGLGSPLGQSLFGGLRYSFTSSTVNSLSGIDSLDLGIQWRPHPRLSTGLMVEGLNRPSIGGQEQPINYTLGITVRPIAPIDLLFDATTASSNFLSTVTYQAGLGVSPARGLRLYAFYHSELKFIAGLTLEFGHARLISEAQTGNGSGRFASGFQFSAEPQPSSFEPKTLKMSFEQNLNETPVRGGLFTPDRPSLMNSLELLEQARNRSNIETVKIRIADFPLGFAAAQEVYEAIWRLRDAGKKVEVYLSNSDVREYLIASAANRIFIEPTAEIKLAGLSVGRYFIKGTLEKIGIEGNFLARGEYKSAPEMFTRTESSPISREQTLGDLKKAEAELRRLIARGRKLSDADWKNIQEKALLSSDEAKNLGLVDEISHFDETVNNFENTPGSESLRRAGDDLALPGRIAVIVAQGDILQRKVKALSFAGEEQLTPNSMEKKFRSALGDPRVKAIVLRISSPGGEVVASDQIASLVEKADKSKPVVVSMGDVAASGGYFIAAPGRKIFASSLTLTGSIGVFLGKFNLAGLYKKIDLHKEILSHAPYPGLLSEDRGWTNEERTILVKRLNQYYESFVAYVANHRHISNPQAESAAKGRVWLGLDAKQNSLIDESGGLLDAIHAAASLGGIADRRYETVTIIPSRGLIDLVGDPEELTGLKGELPRTLRQGLFQEMRWAESLRENPFLYISPIERLSEAP